MLPDVSGSACGHSGFFRRASESTHNNFAIYCGLAMVQCRCYIGLECTILFRSEPTQCLVVGHSGLWSTHDFYNKARRLSSKPSDKVAILTKGIFEVIESTFVQRNILF